MTAINVSARLFKSKPEIYLRAASGGETIRVLSSGRVQAVVVPVERVTEEEFMPAKGSPALLLERIRTRHRPRIKGRTASDMVLEDRG